LLRYNYNYNYNCAGLQTCSCKSGLLRWKVENLDLIEANEAFAAQAEYVNREAKLRQ